MRSSAELALDLGQIDAGTRERLNDILGEGQRLADRVSGLLNFAKAQIGSVERVELQQ